MGEIEPLETIHLYIVKEETAQVVDSTANDTEKIEIQPLAAKDQHNKRFLVPLLILAVNLLIVLSVFFVSIYPILMQTATITILPKSYHFTEQLTLSDVQSRIFQPIRLTQSRTVPATGKGHQDATAASGTITLYNAAPFEQTIDAGTLLIGSDGVHIVTGQIAVIPGATPPIEGQVTVSAHAVNPGRAGNIQAGDIQGACCRENIFAYNSAFSGGADSRDYTIVTQQDINSIVSAILPHLTESIEEMFQKQIRVGELLTTNQCSHIVSTNHNAGDEASQVTVTTRETCVAGAYTQHSLQMQMTKAFLQQVTALTGKGYILQTLHPTRTAIVWNGIALQFRVSCQGDLIYHLSSQELQQVREALTGKTRQQGIALLSRLNGIDHLTVQLGKNGTFPLRASNIHIVFLIVS